MRLALLFNIFFLLTNLVAHSKESVFSGRIVMMDKTSKLLRVKVEFENAKYLRNRDRIQFWSEISPKFRCFGLMKAKASEYILISVSDLESCLLKVPMTVGAYMKFHSQDLDNNLKVGRELVDILMKKRLALDARKTKTERDLEAYNERVATLNKKYTVLREKLELEWQKELDLIESKKNDQLLIFKNTEARLDEIDHKLQRYRIQDKNLKKDRWSLDPTLYKER